MGKRELTSDSWASIGSCEGKEAHSLRGLADSTWVFGVLLPLLHPSLLYMVESHALVMGS